MVNFGLLVENLLNESQIVGVPDWFNKIIDEHDKLFTSNDPITNEDLSDFFDLLNVSGIPETKGLEDYNKIRVLDIMKTLYSVMNPKPTDVNDFKSKLQTDPEVVKISNKLIPQSVNQNNWLLKNKDIIDLKVRSEKLAGQRGADALKSEYGNLNVIQAVEQIVKKRIDFFTRVAKLKSPTTPFTNLITDVFRYPLDYKSGAKKYTSDFEAVDKFYITNLIDIALAANDFYATEIAKLKLTPPPQQPTNASLNLFDLVVGQILTERSRRASRNRGKALRNAMRASTPAATPATPTPAATPATPTPTATSSDPTKSQFFKQIVQNEKGKDVVSVANKIAFLSGKPISYKLVDPNTGEDTEQVVDFPETKQYTVDKINTLNTPESKKLVELLSRVAEYERKKPGTGERMKYATQVASTIWSMGGGKL